MSIVSRRGSVRKEPVDPRQQDLFADDCPEPLPSISAPVARPPEKKAATRRPEKKAKAKARAPVKVRAEPPVFSISDDWWTTSAVCAFLKIGRKALWVMRSDPASDFPAPVDAVGHRHLYLAAEVRAWMDAQRERARLRAQDRRQALRRFSTQSS